MNLITMFTSGLTSPKTCPPSDFYLCKPLYFIFPTTYSEYQLDIYIPEKGSSLHKSTVVRINLACSEDSKDATRKLQKKKDELKWFWALMRKKVWLQM